MKCPHSGGDDPLINDNAPAEVLPRLLLIANLQIIHALLPVLFLGLLPLLKRVLLLADISAIEDTDGLDFVVEEKVDHFEDVVEEVIGIDVLVELKCASVASLIEPRHHVDCYCFALEGADVFF